MSFQSWLSEMGMTGWIFKPAAVPLPGPTSRLVDSWMGTVIWSANGLCFSFASSWADVEATADVSCDGSLAPADSAKKLMSAKPTFCHRLQIYTTSEVSPRGVPGLQDFVGRVPRPGASIYVGVYS